MGISIDQYRRTIGTFCRVPKFAAKHGNDPRVTGPGRIDVSNLTFFIFIYFLVIIYITIISMSIILECTGTGRQNMNIQNILKVGYFQINPTFIVPNGSLITGLFLQLITKVVWCIRCNFKHNPHGNMKCVLFENRNLTFMKCVSTLISIWLFSLNILLIIMSNMSILNPGPPVSGDVLSVYSHNIQGLITCDTLGNANPNLNLTKIFELQSYVYHHRPDIIALNETWLKPSIKNEEILDPDIYKIFRLDRSPLTHPIDPKKSQKYKKNGGGVLIAIKNELGLKPTICKSTLQAELLTIKLSNSMIISTFYRVGTLGCQNHHEVDSHLRHIAKNKKVRNHLLTGDLNLDSVDWTRQSTPNSLHKKYLDTFNDIGLIQMIDEPTHSKGGLLDLVLTNNPNVINSVRVLDLNESIKSDHKAIVFSVKIRVPRLKQQKHKLYNFSKANWEDLNLDLSRINWDHILAHHEPEGAWNIFKSTLKHSCDKRIPTITTRAKNQPPWFDSEVHKLCLKKEKYRKLFKNSNSPVHEKKFKDCRKQVKSLIKEKMRSNFQDEAGPDTISKKFWSYVKFTSKSARIPETVSYSGKFRNKPADKADLFNQFFFNQFSESSKYDININFTNDTSYNYKIDFREVRKILKSLNQHKSMGPDGISGRVLKMCAGSLAYPITYIYNLSFACGSLPSQWKMANIVPIHKKGDKSLVDNYRPISLTCIVMKVFEKCIRNELMNRCQDKLHPSQHGFLPGKSCTTQMIPFTNDLSVNLNNNDRTDIIYFDFSKAFDSVNHDLILKKLKYEYKIDGMLLKFIKEYLHNRMQSVILGDVSSQQLEVLSGVPQGSILGPLLFVLFINDIHAAISPGTKCALYADDTKIWRTIVTESDCFALQNDITSLHNWSKTNLMNFHPHKCKVMSIKLKADDNILPFSKFPYMLGNVMLDYVNEEKDLGIIVNSTLKWDTHQHSILSKANNMFNLMRRTCHFVKNSKKRRTLYLTLIRSLFEHGSVVWTPTSQKTILAFEALQKRCIKWVLNEQFQSYKSAEYILKLKQLDILPLQDKFALTDLKIFHKIVHNLISIDLPDFLVIRRATRSTPSHQLSFGISDNIKNLKPCFKNNFFVRNISAWNALPIDLRESSDSNKFCSATRKILWEKILATHHGELIDLGLQPI